MSIYTVIWLLCVVVDATDSALVIFDFVCWNGLVVGEGALFLGYIEKGKKVIREGDRQVENKLNDNPIHIVAANARTTTGRNVQCKERERGQLSWFIFPCHAIHASAPPPSLPLFFFVMINDKRRETETTDHVNTGWIVLATAAKIKPNQKRGQWGAERVDFYTWLVLSVSHCSRALLTSVKRKNENVFPPSFPLSLISFPRRSSLSFFL